MTSELADAIETVKDDVDRSMQSSASIDNNLLSIRDRLAEIITI